MSYNLNTPGVVNVAVPTDTNFTHITLNGLLMKFPDLDPDGVQARIIWRKGKLESGVFVALSQHESVVPEGPFLAWLQATDTGNAKNFRKLETVMFNYLVSSGEITPGTIVDI